MRPLTASELLQVWERGASQSPPRRMLELLAASAPELGAGQLAALPIGERDRRLLRLRQWLFGPNLATVTACPQCGEQLESTLDTAAMIAEAVGESEAAPGV